MGNLKLEASVCEYLSLLFSLQTLDTVSKSWVEMNHHLFLNAISEDLSILETAYFLHLEQASR